MNRTVVCLLLLVLTAPVGSGGIDEDVEDPAPYIHPEVTGDTSHARLGPVIEPLGDDRYRIGNLLVDRGAREVWFPGEVAAREGVLEYVACATLGRLDESLLLARVDPYHLHLALLLIGLEPGNDLEPTPESGQVTVHVTWQSDEGPVTYRAEELIREAVGRSMRKTSWIFTGSRFVDGTFLASVNRSLIAVNNDPTAILNNPLAPGSDDATYGPNTGLLPPMETELQIIIRAEGS